MTPTLRYSLWLGLALLPALAPAAAAAQDLPAPAPLQAAAQTVTLDELLRLASAAPSVRQAEAAERQAGAALAAARAAAGFGLTAGGEYNISSLAAAEAVGPSPAQEATTSGSGALTLDGRLSVLPWSPALEGARQAERAAKAASARTAQARRDALLNVLRDYAGLEQAAEGIRTAEEALTLNRQALAASEGRARDGLLDPAGLLDASSALAEAEANLARARSGLELAQRRLSSRVGQAVRIELPSAGTAAIPFTRPALPDLADLQAAALSRRPEVLQARAAVADAQAALDTAARDARLPEASASIRAGELNPVTGGAGRSVSGTFDLRSGTLGAQVRLPLGEGKATYRTSVGLNLRASVPLLGGGRSEAAAQAEAGLAAAQQALTQAEDGLRLELEAAYSEAVYALDSLTAAELSQRSAQAALERTRARVEAGLDTPLNLTQAQLRLLNTTAQVHQAQRQARLNWLDLWRLGGELEPELLRAAWGLTPPAAPPPLPDQPAPDQPAPSQPSSPGSQPAPLGGQTQ